LNRLAVEVHLDTLHGTVLHARARWACLTAIDAGFASSAVCGGRVTGTHK
jgi:hypothetical protein